MNHLPSSKIPRRVYLGIFTTSAAVLLYELVLTRIFAVILWAHLAFMIVGTALFGFALSGVYLAIRRSKRPFSLSLLCLCSSIGMIAAYLVVLFVPFQMWSYEAGWINYLFLLLWYCSLLVPFFFAGLTIAEVLSRYPLSNNRLYGVDLLGAACGSMLLLVVLPAFAGEGGVFITAALSALAALCYADWPSRRYGFLITAVIAVQLITACFADQWLPVRLHQAKRAFKTAQETNSILATRWSAISRVDIAHFKKNVRAIWIDGGTNHSGMRHIAGKVDELAPIKKQSVGIAYALKYGQSPQVMVIGSSGGREVLYALTYGAKHVDAVEMDPSIVKFVNRPDYAEYMGHLFQNPRVTLINDEGRAYLRRQPPESYDIIQFVNNYTPVAMAAGALNLSETFLLTTEAFKDYWSHLTSNGILALHRGATLRVAMTAAKALHELGIDHPERHILIVRGEFAAFEGFLLKKSPWTEEEVNQVRQYCAHRKWAALGTFLWNPFSDLQPHSLYSKILRLPVEEQSAYYQSQGVNLFPATDDRPFIEHYLRISRSPLASDVPGEFKRFNEQKWRHLIPRGDFPYVIILVESALLGLFFIGVPLILHARSSIKTAGFFNVFGYFGALGLGFIIIEICLMKRYVLFLGNPIYSLTTILVVLLLGAGLGSMCSEKLAKRGLRQALPTAFSALLALLLFEMLLAPHLFELFLHLSFGGRIFIASVMLLPLGFFMGMPFPLGLRVIGLLPASDDERKKLLAWAWGVNGYTTVIGSAGTVFLALQFGFQTTLLVAVAVYLLGLICLWPLARKASAV